MLNIDKKEEEEEEEEEATRSVPCESSRELTIDLSSGRASSA